MTASRSIPFLGSCLFACLLWLASCTQAPSPPDNGGTLDPGASLTTATGTVVGAPPGALESPLKVRSVATDAPDAAALPDGASALGPAVRLEPSRVVATPMDAPLLVGLPIPEGEATDHLAAAVLIPAGSIDYDISGDNPALAPADTWQLLRGQVDASDRLFISALTSVPAGGQTLVLVEAPEASSPTVATAVPGATAAPGAGSSAPSASNARPSGATEPGSAATAPGSAGTAALNYTFSTYCEGFAILGRASECTSADRNAAAQALSDVFHDLLGEGFAYPSLRRTYVTSGLFPPKVTAVAYVAYLHPYRHTSGGSEVCRVDSNKDGYITGVYIHSLSKIIVCLGQTEAPQFGPSQTLVMRHEYFHATQYAYTSSAPSWFKESTAVASEKSLTSFARSSKYPHHVDVFALSDIEKYRLQDFWVYLGKRNNLALRDLIPFLQAGGGLTDVEQVLANDPRFGSLGGLGPSYWAWVKNQAFEKSVALAGVEFQTRCAPFQNAGGDLTLLKHGGPEVLAFDPQGAAPAPVGATLHALTAAIYRVDLPALPAGNYQVTPRVTTTAPRVKAKFYSVADAGTSACDARPDQMSRTITVSAGHDQQWYVLVANTDTHDPADVTVSIPGTSAGVAIVEPAAGTSVEEGQAVALQAQPFGFGATDPQTIQVTWTYPRWDGVPVTAAVTSGDNGATLDGLCDGSYTLTATARDPSTGRSATDEVVLTVTQPADPQGACAPAVTIADPADGSVFPLGATVDFTALIEDDHPETDAPVFPLTWFDGGVSGVPIQSGTTAMSRSDLGVGTHSIAVVYGNASDTIDVTIVDTSNTSPSAAIAFPGMGDTLLYSDYNAGHPSLMYVPLGGNGFDAEDGTVGLSWFYRKVGAADWTFIGTGRTPTWILAFEQGNVDYQIRLLAVDSGGLQGEDVRTVTVQGPLG